MANVLEAARYQEVCLKRVCTGSGSCPCSVRECGGATTTLALPASRARLAAAAQVRHSTRTGLDGTCTGLEGSCTGLDGSCTGLDAEAGKPRENPSYPHVPRDWGRLDTIEGRIMSIAIIDCDCGCDCVPISQPALNCGSIVSNYETGTTHTHSCASYSPGAVRVPRGLQPPDHSPETGSLPQHRGGT